MYNEFSQNAHADILNVQDSVSQTDEVNGADMWVYARYGSWKIEGIWEQVFVLYLR